MIRSGVLGVSVLVMGLTGVAAQEELPAAVRPEVQTAEWAQSWWMPRHEEKLAAIAEGDIELVMIGDSITHGWENAGKAMWAKYYAGRKAVNLGFSGDRTEHVLWRLQHGAVEGLSPKLCVIMIGTNNTGHRQDPPADTALGIQRIIEELQERVPMAKVLLLAVFPRGATAEDELRQINDGVNAIIKTYADDERVFWLDLNEVFLDENGDLPKEIMPDLLHPNVQGYVLWAEAMEPRLAALLAE